MPVSKADFGVTARMSPTSAAANSDFGPGHQMSEIVGGAVRDLAQQLLGSEKVSLATEARLVRQMMSNTRAGLIVAAVLMTVLAVLAANANPHLRGWAFIWWGFAMGSVCLRFHSEWVWLRERGATREDAYCPEYVRRQRPRYLYTAVAWGSSTALFYGNVPWEMQCICWAIVAGAATWAQTGFAQCPSLQRIYTHSLFITMAVGLVGAAYIEPRDYGHFNPWFLMLPGLHWLLLMGHARKSHRVAIENLARQDELSAQRKAAEDAVNLKNRFLASAAHDLRQPVLALKLYAEMLEQHTQQEPASDIHQYAQAIVEGAKAVAALSDSLFSLAKLDTGVTLVQVNQVDVREMVEDLHRRYLPIARSRGLSLRLKLGVGTEQAAVRSDRVQLERLLGNLITNGLKYTVRGSVAIALMRDDRGLAVEVRDTGIGIAKEDQEKVFGEFVKLAGAKDTGSKDGFGLGLAIVTRLSHLLNHPVGVTSKPGKGSVFRVVLHNADQRHVDHVMAELKGTMASARMHPAAVAPTAPMPSPNRAEGMSLRA